ncbi:hypothetical protein [Marinoscillum furvescens]|uniref:Uncharacterized protein n=1 Tax=Marinoscillum furvescens DSM 4134 TaxID=1122208 RepID=A0A3D9LII7_MARFU|nr:hypothetical protein [Marinoscillum furvescens]REE05633.1 hypothetical protein C7460_101150 [Marinoscillum furvescens DSM 4134]
MAALEKYYPGDKAWNNFAKLYSEHTDSQTYRKLYMKLKQDEELTNVIYGKIGAENCVSWVDVKIPAIGYQSVLDLIELGNILGVRTLLMRM